MAITPSRNQEAALAKAVQASGTKMSSEWRPTGKGLMVTKPKLKATALNANASLVVRGAREEDEKSKIFLFVDRVMTSWQVAGSYAQAVLSRTWVPRNLTMSDLVITGTTASQHEYDLLVDFIRDNQRNSISQADVIYDDDQSVQVPYLEFRMFEPGIISPNRIKTTYRHIPGANAKHKIHMFVIPTDIVAGHERFKFAPAYTITCKVLFDAGDPDANRDVILGTMREVDYQQVFGVLSNPDPEGPEIDPKLPQSTYSGGSGGGTGAGGGGDYSPGGGGDWEQYKDQIAAAAPGLSNPTGGDPIKAKYPDAWPSTPGLQYFAAWVNDHQIIDGKIRVKYRDPPGAGNTIDVTI